MGKHSNTEPSITALDIKALLNKIDRFSEECSASEYTDTGIAWNLLDEARAMLVKLTPPSPKANGPFRCGGCGYLIEWDPEARVYARIGIQGTAVVECQADPDRGPHYSDGKGIVEVSS